MGKCTNCGAALDPSWKFCVTCGTAVVLTESTPAGEAPGAAIPEPIPAAIRPIAESDDEPVPRKRPDIAVIVGVVMALGGGVLIILVAIALFSPRG
jgi:hypothetical protein